MSQVATAPEPATARGAQTEHQHILIVGGGTAGITLGARLRRKLGGSSLGLVEPSERHYYQPLWTLVGGGVFDKRKTERREDSLIPKGATWIRDAASEFVPEENELVTAGGRGIGYDFLVVCPGIQIDWDAIPGLATSVGKDSVCSIYSYETVDRTWDLIRKFQGGSAVFTFPSTPVKCPGAAQKIMYLADDHWRKLLLRRAPKR
jgi:sulfide:quinone oxidoreductase